MIYSQKAPYVGLAPFGEPDAPFFFGRDREKRLLIANLLATRLTLVYGPSGVGKSSLLAAGVVHELRLEAAREQNEGGHPEFLVTAFASWRDEPSSQIASEILDALLALNIPRAPTNARLNPNLPLLNAVKLCSALGVAVLIILDQFEEYFLYQPSYGATSTFSKELVSLISSSNLHCNVLIAIREDCLGRLDYFKGSVKSVFGNYLRIEPLDALSWREAIEKPVAFYNSFHDANVTIDDDLAPLVLDAIRSDAKSVVAANSTSPSSDAFFIAAPYLQLVMLKIWEREASAGSQTLRLSTFKKLGGVDQIVRQHVEQQLEHLGDKQREQAFIIFHYLVTPSGTKVAHTASDLAAYSGVSRDETLAVLSELSRSSVRILRSIPPPQGSSATETRYEIFHDVLAGSVQDWRLKETERRKVSIGKLCRLAFALFAALIGLSYGLSANISGRLTSKAESLLSSLIAMPSLRPRVTVVAIGDDEYWRGGLVESDTNLYLANLIRTISSYDPIAIGVDYVIKQLPPVHSQQDSAAIRSLIASLTEVSRHVPIVVATEVKKDRGEAAVDSYLSAIQRTSGSFSGSVIEGHQQYSEANLRRLPSPLRLRRDRLDSFSSAIARAATGTLKRDIDHRLNMTGAFLEPDRFDVVMASALSPLRNSATKNSNYLQRKLFGHPVIVGFTFHTLGPGEGPPFANIQTPLIAMPEVFLQANYVEARLTGRYTHAWDKMVVTGVELLGVLLLTCTYTLIMPHAKLALASTVGPYIGLVIIGLSLPALLEISTDILPAVILLTLGSFIDPAPAMQKILEYMVNYARGFRQRAQTTT